MQFLCCFTSFTQASQKAYSLRWATQKRSPPFFQTCLPVRQEYAGELFNQFERAISYFFLLQYQGGKHINSPGGGGSSRVDAYAHREFAVRPISLLVRPLPMVRRVNNIHGHIVLLTMLRNSGNRFELAATISPPNI